jgi:hypothetical protein
MSLSLDEARVPARFDASGRLVSLEPHTSGLINHSWLANVESAGTLRRYLLQQINRHVFHRPAEVLENMLRIAAHLRARLTHEAATSSAACRRWFRRGARSRGRVRRDLAPRAVDRGHASARGERSGRAETARAFGSSAHVTDPLPARAHFTIPAFHDTKARARSA